MFQIGLITVALEVAFILLHTIPGFLLSRRGREDKKRFRYGLVITLVFWLFLTGYLQIITLGLSPFRLALLTLNFLVLVTVGLGYLLGALASPNNARVF